MKSPRRRVCCPAEKYRDGDFPTDGKAEAIQGLKRSPLWRRRLKIAATGYGSPAPSGHAIKFVSLVGILLGHSGQSKGTADIEAANSRPASATFSTASLFF
ncbi:hypothetical protein PMIN01_05787 [Paraphaeosphaeria minitans]|uniref:Uncharacterized protein n=1 Tax=Paraphaeosphaeria minitans TaxID=565426 RepID=A0A9P6GHM5_9PLEO|nr:hypothetical protein PMIN01_05787 [Paraphaeosphaeria minitans]